MFSSSASRDETRAISGRAHFVHIFFIIIDECRHKRVSSDSAKTDKISDIIVIIIIILMKKEKQLKQKQKKREKSEDFFFLHFGELDEEGVFALSNIHCTQRHPANLKLNHSKKDLFQLIVEKENQTTNS